MPKPGVALWSSCKFILLTNLPATLTSWQWASARAPEVLVIIPRKEFGKVGYCALKADVFSMGVMLYRLLNKNLPFYAPSIKDSKKLASTVVTKMQCEALLQQQAMSQSLKFHPGVSGEAINLVLAMLRNNPQERPTMEQVLKHTWHKTVVPQSLQNLYTSGYSLDY